MKKFFVFQKGQALPAQLPWTHYRQLLPMKNNDEINYYVNISIEQHLSSRKLQEKIKNKEYQRLNNETKNKLINNEELNIYDNIKNPIIINTFNNNINKENIIYFFY